MVSTVDASKVPFSLIPRYKMICNSNIVVFGMINGMVRYIRFNDSGTSIGGGNISKAKAKQLFIYHHAVPLSADLHTYPGAPNLARKIIEHINVNWKLKDVE